MSNYDPQTTYWLELKDGQNLLVVDGVPRGKYVEHKSSVVVFNGQQAKAGIYAVPSRLSGYEYLEKRIGVSRVERFRYGQGRAIDESILRSNMRRAHDKAVAEHNAKQTPAKSVQDNLKKAWKTLDSVARLEDGLTVNGSLARSELSRAIFLTKPNSGQWTDEAREHLHNAVEYLHKCPSEDIYALARKECQSALSQIDMTPGLRATQSAAPEHSHTRNRSR